MIFPRDITLYLPSNARRQVINLRHGLHDHMLPSQRFDADYVSYQCLFNRACGKLSCQIDPIHRALYESLTQELDDSLSGCVCLRSLIVWYVQKSLSCYGRTQSIPVLMSLLVVRRRPSLWHTEGSSRLSGAQKRLPNSLFKICKLFLRTLIK